MIPGASSGSYSSERIEKTLQKYSRKDVAKTATAVNGVVTLGLIRGSTRNGGLAG